MTEIKPNDAADKSELILDKLYPPFADKLRQLIAALGEDWRIVEGYRTFDEQNAYYEQGRSRPGALITRDRAGYSGHNYGTVVHLAPTAEGERDNVTYLKLADTAKSLGLEWGGNDVSGKFIEMSRVEMVILSMDECLAIFKKGMPALWAAFDEKLGIVKPPSETLEEVEAARVDRAQKRAAAQPVVKDVALEPDAAIKDEPEEEDSPESESAVVARRKRTAAKKGE